MYNENYFCFLDEEIENQMTPSHREEEEVKYEIPKPLNEIGISYVTMKDFKFNPEQQAQIV